MSKLAFFFLTLVGAVPAGGTLYLLINNLLDRADKLGGVLLGISIAAAVCMVLIVLTPFIVLVFYKDTRVAGVAMAGAATAAAGAAAAGAAAAGAADDDDGGFDDAIPDDYDEEELAASASVDEYDDDSASYDESYDDGEFDDFDMDELED